MEQERKNGTERQIWENLKRVDNLKKRDKMDTDFKKTGKRQGAVADRDNVQNQGASPEC